MALQLQISTDEISIRYRQPYVSEALNRKASSEDSGVQKGFIPSTIGAMPNAIKLLADEVSGTSVMNLTNSADKEFTVAWVKEGDFEITVPAVAQWHHLFVDHGYEFGSETTPTMTWYTDGEVTDPAVIQHGIYLCSALGVAAGQNVSEVKTLAAVGGSGLALKRSTSSTALARTRVRGYNEEPVFFTDFSGASMSPVDLTPGLTKSVTAKIALDGQTFSQDGGVAGVLNLVAETETGSHGLLFHRRPSDTENSLNGTNTKRFALPAYIPVGEDPEGTSPTRTLRVAVRFKSVRNFALRFAGTNPDWSLSVNFAYNRSEPLIGPNVIGGISTYTISPTQGIQSTESITLSNQANGVGVWNWGVAEFKIPNADSVGNYASVTGASLVVTIPDMLADEYILIDRVLVESDVSPSTHGIDGHRTLTANALGRFASYSPDDGGADTLITPSAQGLAIAPAGGIRSVDAGGRVRYALEAAGHSTSIGLPLIDEDNDAFFDYSYSDRSIERRDNTPASFERLVNLFKQSNVIINAPGAYDTSAIIESIEAFGGTVGDGLRAPLNAGLTVNDGNVFANRAVQRLNAELVTQNGPPSHLTGHVIAYGNVSEDGYYLGTVENGEFVPSGSVHTISAFESGRFAGVTASLTAYYSTDERAYDVMSLSRSTIASVLSPGEYSAIDPAYIDLHKFNERLYDQLAVLVVDISQESRHSTLNIKDSLLTGIREDVKGEVVGTETFTMSQPIVRHAHTSIFPTASGLTLSLDNNINSLSSGGSNFQFDNRVGAANWLGDAYLTVGLNSILDASWDSGQLRPAQSKIMRGQFCTKAELLNTGHSLGVIADGLSGGSRGDLVGMGVQIRHTIGFMPVDSRSAYSETQYMTAGSPTFLLDTSTQTATSGGTDFVTMADADGQKLRILANLMTYLLPVKSDGSTYGSLETLEANGVFLYEALMNPSAYPALSDEHQVVASAFRQPIYELCHRISHQADVFQPDYTTNRVSNVAEGRMRVGVYDFYAQITGMGTRTNASQPYRPYISDPNNPPNLVQFLGLLSSALNGAFPLNDKNHDYWWKVDGNQPNEVNSYTAARDALIAENGAGFDISKMNNNRFRHEYMVSLCYDASFLATSLVAHPITLVPVLRDAQFPVKRSKL